ncbi:MAG: putative transcriptional regulator [Candidatus Magasanikbacteria bacterium GW2011_GWC2_40_17]|uniref:Putative transcriptional regulator n=1 Tax=Candidatus Magasanikbacteria bacterium GW2011_GWA2_42_32 TaxID=1619039 RepID=A0A0G1A7E3_9BACT|nr:MAG: putative transcriptional regulator [Candidatus Magasanikbacteria bacterium GW2011_GWC2_40_17]KKS56967.1 MAG: putative transcriptional regulator [Candidatus Magasanikbacteria bacterium GW2011_GWA2_42_32]OGH85697.1 MAG: hypothetical protein A2294_03660 [Candidatus Magasanikbacteria bacterium RIFOXYB2_FULL_38_10]
MLEHLFGSKTRLKVLKFFLANPDKDFFVRELSRKLGLPINAIRRELGNLSALQVVMDSDKKDSLDKSPGAEKRKYYKLNTGGHLNKELENLLIKDRFSKEQNFISSLKNLSGIEFLLLSGHFVENKGSSVDILLVGTILPKEAEKTIKNFEKETEEELRYTLMKTKEFIFRRDVADKFLSDVLSDKHLILIDKIKVPKSLF